MQSYLNPRSQHAERSFHGKGKQVEHLLLQD